MCAMGLENLADRLIEYILDSVSDNDSADDAQIRKIKAMKIFLQERQEDVWELGVGIGMAEAYFSLNGEKRSGSLGGMIERLVRQWLMRPFNQEAIKNLIKK